MRYIAVLVVRTGFDTHIPGVCYLVKRQVQVSARALPDVAPSYLSYNSVARVESETVALVSRCEAMHIIPVRVVKRAVPCVNRAIAGSVDPGNTAIYGNIHRSEWAIRVR